jgi:hypothetical protein
MFLGLAGRGIPDTNGYQLVARTSFISDCIMTNQFRDAANVKIIHGPWWKKGFQFELDQHSKLGIQNGL